MKRTASRKRISITRRITFTNIVIFLTGSILSILGTLHLNVRYHIRRDAQMMDVYISNTMNSVDNMLKDMGRVSLVAFSDQTVQSILKGSGYSYMEERRNEDYLKNLYNSLISIRDDIKGIYMFNMKDMVFYSDASTPTLGLERNVEGFFGEVRRKSDSKTKISGCHMYVAELPEGFSYMETYTEDIFQKKNVYLVRPIRSFSPFEVIGYIAIRTPVRKLKDICDEYLEQNISYLIADEDNNIVCCTDQEFIGKSLESYHPGFPGEVTDKKGDFSIAIGEKQYLCSYQKSGYSNMLLITMKPYASIFDEINNLLVVCILLTILCSLIVLVSVSVLTRRNLKRLTDFSVELQNFRPDDLSRHYEVEYMDEVGVLKDSFNKMMARINDLVISEYQVRDRLQKMEISEQKMAMLYLKQQINPHFLYNTLDMIRLKAAINQDTEVSEMLMKLVKFYRLSTKVYSSMVSVQKEVEMLEAYMGLMCYRYSELRYQADISDDVLDLEIPNFILQPLIENSLLHGLKDRRYQGTIILKAFEDRTDHMLEIRIIDDGIGMAQEKLDELNDYCRAEKECLYRVQLEKQGGTSHLGIINVISRLKLYYQENCRIRYSGNEMGGTSVTIRIKTERD